MAENTDVFHIIHTTRAMRRLKPDPVPEALLVRLVEAGDQAPSGSNLQMARWIVVRDPEIRMKLAELNKTAVAAYIGPSSGRPSSLPHQSAGKRKRMLDAVLWLLDFPDPLTVSGTAQQHFGSRGQKTWAWHRNNPSGAFSVEDSATAFVRLDGGISLSLETSWASHARPGLDDFYITLLGTEGTVELYVQNYASENTLTFYTELNGVPVATHPAVSGVRADHDYAIAEFVRCVREDLPSTATAAEGQTIMQVIDAIYRSAEIGREVILGSANL